MGDDVWGDDVGGGYVGGRRVEMEAPVHTPFSNPQYTLGLTSWQPQSDGLAASPCPKVAVVSTREHSYELALLSTRTLTQNARMAKMIWVYDIREDVMLEPQVKPAMVAA